MTGAASSLPQDPARAHLEVLVLLHEALIGQNLVDGDALAAHPAQACGGQRTGDGLCPASCSSLPRLSASGLSQDEADGAGTGRSVGGQPLRTLLFPGLAMSPGPGKRGAAALLSLWPEGGVAQEACFQGRAAGQGEGGRSDLLPRTSSGPGGGWQKQGARRRRPPVSGPPHARPRAVLGLHLSPVRSWGPVWFLIGDPQRLGSTRYVAGSRLEIHRSSSIVAPHLYQVASSIKDEEAEAQRRSLTHPRPYSWWLSP